MNIDHLKLFTRVAATGNISQSGKEFGLSPAVSSAHISKLEDDLGVRLIHRTTRKVSLTEEGSAFLPHAIEVLDSVENARASVGGGDVCPQGKLRITAPASFGRMHILPALKTFLNQYRDLEVEMHLSDTIVNLVEGGYDIAIRDAEMQDSSMVARKLASDDRILCASPEYLEKYGTPRSVEDLQKHQCVNLIGLESWTLFKDEKSTVFKTQNRLRVDNGEAARDAAIEGLGITLTSTWCSYKALKSGGLVRVLADYELLSNASIWAVYPSTRLLAPKVRVFIDYLAEYFSETPYWEDELR